MTPAPSRGLTSQACCLRSADLSYPLQPLSDRRRIGRKDVAAFFCSFHTRTGEEANVGGFVVETGEQSRFDDSTATDKRAGIEGAMARTLPLF